MSGAKADLHGCELELAVTLRQNKENSIGLV